MEEKIIRPTTKPEAIKGKLLKYQGTDYCKRLIIKVLPLRNHFPILIWAVSFGDSPFIV